jgi:dihydroxyacetone kinase
LEEVAEAARRVAASVRTLGVSLSPVSIPGRPSPDRMATGTAELGLGIHGEPGATTVAVETSSALVGRMAATLAQTLPAGPVALLVNDLGGMAALELGVVLRDLLDTELGARAELLVGPTAGMTSLSAQGFSLSALPLDDATRGALLAPVAGHTAWAGAHRTGPLRPEPLPDRDVAPPPPSDNAAVRALLTAVCTGLVDARERLDALDARVGDGDTGTTFATAARRLLDRLDHLPLDDTPELLTTVSAVLATSMGGSSGVLGAIFFAAAGRAAAAGDPPAESLHAGLLAMQRDGGAAVGDRTMVDALAPALDALRGGGTLTEAADAAERGAAATAAMVAARAGRSAYVPGEHLLEVEDPGAAAIAAAFRAAAGSRAVVA